MKADGNALLGCLPSFTWRLHQHRRTDTNLCADFFLNARTQARSGTTDVFLDGQHAGTLSHKVEYSLCQKIGTMDIHISESQIFVQS